MPLSPSVFHAAALGPQTRAPGSIQFTLVGLADDEVRLPCA